MTVAPCETFGRWHRWRTIEVVGDRRDVRGGHSLRVMRCARCGTRSWRWAPPTDHPGPVAGELAPAEPPHA